MKYAIVSVYGRSLVDAKLCDDPNDIIEIANAMLREHMDSIGYGPLFDAAKAGEFPDFEGIEFQLASKAVTSAWCNLDGNFDIFWHTVTE